MNHKAAIRPIILAGGAGKRLWPLSRAMYPKQFQRLSGPHSLLQDTVDRVSSPRFSSPVIVCNEEHRFIVAEQLAERGVLPADIILEPVGRGTGPAILLAAHWMQRHDPDGIMLILPSDHAVDDPDAFIGTIDRAEASARSGALATFGIPATGAGGEYGYIQPAEKPEPATDDRRAPASSTSVSLFREKPDKETAIKMLAEGAYWNSGIFLVSAKSCLDEADRHAPEIATRCGDSLAQAEHDMDFLRIAASPFTDNPVISFDRLILEETDKAIVFPLKVGWCDLHVWSSVYENAQPDKNGNVIIGDIMTQDCRNTFIKSDQMLVAAIGVKDMAIVATDDAILITDIGQTENVGQTVEMIAQSGSTKHLHHSTLYRPWGSLKTVLAASEFLVRELIIQPGRSLSLQKHLHRAEHWVVVEGTAEIMRNDGKILLRENESFYVSPDTPHRLTNPGKIALRIVEVQSGLYLGEDDVVRLEGADGRQEMAGSSR